MAENLLRNNSITSISHGSSKMCIPALVCGIIKKINNESFRNFYHHLYITHFKILRAAFLYMSECYIQKSPKSKNNLYCTKNKAFH